MSNFLERRRIRKYVRHILHEARHARHMREDVANPEKIEALREAEHCLRDAWKRQDRGAVEQAMEEVTARTAMVYPSRPRAKVREYVEIAVVAVAVAMGFRTYFIQPFRIPTGSMQPTLAGITVEARERSPMDRFPFSTIRLVLFGERYIEIRAPRSGVVQEHVEINDGSGRTALLINGALTRPIPRGMRIHAVRGEHVEQGDILASGQIRAGDHIFVNKVKYNFMRPRRGEIFVFRTDDIDHPDVKEDAFYIKRLVALPNEVVSIDPPYLVVDGGRLTEPKVFDRQAHARDRGYFGYVFPDSSRHERSGLVLRNPGDELHLSATQYLPLGDNTRFSLDGRYFGAVDQQNIVGPAFMVYWPLGARWGFVH